MELTLLLPAGEAARFQRHPILKATRTGRTRSAATRIVWYDEPDFSLAARGLALAEQNGVWRLEQHEPGPFDVWPPTTDHRLIEETPPGAAMSAAAAFEGRRIVYPLTIDGSPMTATLLTGVLRTVAAERPAGRLILDGPDAAVRSLLSGLADTLPLTVPTHSLAVEALHLARGTEPPPRRTGAPAVAPDMVPGGLTVESAFAHILGHLTGVLLHLAPLAADPATGPEPVHQMRVTVRRARSAVSLFQPALDSPALTRAADGLRALSQVLGPARDWDVFMTETVAPVEEALPDRSGLSALLRAGARRRRDARAALSVWLTGPDFRLLTLDLACLSAAGAMLEDPPPLTVFAAHALHGRWKKVTNTGKSLDELDNPGLHGLRLKAKRLRYAAEFFAPLFPGKATTRFIRRLSVLQERLGVFNDTAVAESLLRQLNATPGHAAGLVLGFTAARGANIKPKIAAAWVRFRRRDPFWD